MRKFTTTILLIFVFLLALSSRASSAYLIDLSQSRVNLFGAGEIKIELVEDFTANVKKNVQVKNTGTSPAYLRLAIVPVWKKGADVAAVPVEASDYSLSLNTVDWFKKGNYYYLKNPVEPGQLSPVLINEAKVLGKKTGLNLEIQVLASAIQAEPGTAVSTSWPVTSANGVLAP